MNKVIINGMKFFITRALLIFGVVIFSVINYKSKAQVTPVAYGPTSVVNSIRTWTAESPQTDPLIMMTKSIKEVKQSTSYFDGLGRPLQTVVKQGSLVTPDGSPSTIGTPVDLVSTNVYDNFGREQTKYLPFAASNTGSNYSVSDGNFKFNPFQQQNAFYSNSTNISPIAGQAESYFYSKTNYELSPLNRPTEEYAPGNNWVGTEQTTKYSGKTNYYINTLADAVRIWNVNVGATGSFSTYESPGVYTAGSLTKTIYTDEKGNQVIEFKDLEDKVILKKVQLITTTGIADDGTGRGHDNFLCTYYLYDNLNNLRCVIQPQGVELIKSGWVLTDATILAEQCFRYEYDQLNRMIIKKVPGAGEVYIVYDARDRQVMTQDANMRMNAQWMVTVYDYLNRAIQTGLLTSITSDFTTHLNGAYGSISYPATTSNFELLTVSHYDDYTALPAGVSSTGYLSDWNSYFSLTNNSSYPYSQLPVAVTATKGMLTWKQTKILGTTSTFINTAIYYDDKGRVVQNQSTNISGGLDVITTQYSWSGKPLLTVQKHEKLGTSIQTSIVITQTSYDDLGRVSKIEKKLSNSLVNNNGMSEYKNIAEMQYDALGQLKKKKIGNKPLPAISGTPLANLDYEYNIRGWLLSINKNYINSPSNADQYFGMQLGYDKNGAFGTFTPQYNGNISGTIWKSEGDQQKRKYDFTYDALNRLTGAGFNQYISGTGSTAIFNTTAGVDFSVENLSYDANGNILTMWQKGLKINTSEYIDKLKYNYSTKSNKLLNVIDFVNEPTTTLGDFRTKNHPQGNLKTQYIADPVHNNVNNITDYYYDENGNLTSDYNKEIRGNSVGGGFYSPGITYNYLNLPILITMGGFNGSIQYTYDAVGNKLQKTVAANGQSTKVTTYINGFVYENDMLQFVPQEEGRIRFKPQQGSLSANLQFDYFLKDHLGNVRMVLTEEEQQDKYPVASLEPTKLATEKSYYDIKDAQVVDKSTATGITNYINDNGIGNNPTDAAFSATNNTKLYQLNSNTAKTGLGITLKVMAGDKIDVLGKSYYFTNTSGTGGNNTVPVIDLLAAFLAAPGAAANTTGHGLITPTIINTPTGITGINSMVTQQTSQSNTTPNKPRAFINVIFFDEQFKSVDFKISMVGNNSAVKDHFTELQNLVATKSGYVYIYCSNESPVNVFFDNLQVVQTRSPILEETHYYPFGLTMAGISSKSFKSSSPNCGCGDNKKGFNGNEMQSKEFSDGSGLEIYDFNARTYDQQIGRFLQIDPIPDEGEQESLSLYHFGGDNPILYNDPDGECPWCWGALIGAAVDYGLQVSTNLVQGKSLGKALTDIDGKSILVSAGAGAISGGISAISKVKQAGTVAKVIVEVATDTGISAGSQLIKDGKVSLKKTLIDVTAGQIVGRGVGKVVKTKAVNSTTAKRLKENINKEKNIARGKSNTTSKLNAKIEVAKKELDGYVNKRAAVSSATASGVFSTTVEQVTDKTKKN